MVITDMNIILLDINKNMCNQWKRYFSNMENIKIENCYLDTYLKNNQVDCIVSPANSFGIMDGGYDLAITKWYGYQLMTKVQDIIYDKYYGEQPVTSSILVETESNPKYLIHTPTMRYPMLILDTEVIYHCMRNTLITALNNNIQSIIIPAFGGATGGVQLNTIAYMMYQAYLSLINPIKCTNFSMINMLN